MADSNRDKVVYFVRHGQSEDNSAPVLQSPHAPLSAVGRQQAERIAERVSHLSFDALLASPYQRAKATADAIGKVTGNCTLFRSDHVVCRIQDKLSATGLALMVLLPGMNMTISLASLRSTCWTRRSHDHSALLPP